MITLLGNPASTNNIYKYTCRGRFPHAYMTDRGLGLKTYYQHQAKMQWKQEILKGEIELNIRLFFGDLRKHDIDNYNKILLDSLTGIVWEDDCQVQRINIQKGLDRENPRIEIDICERATVIAA